MKNICIGQEVIQYTEKGTGEVLLFIHGAFSSGHTWRKIVPKLSQTYRCIIPEWPFGGHEIPVQDTADLTPPGIASFILQVLDALGIQEVTIIANDTGGAYAQVFTSLYSNRVKKLVLSNCEGFEVFPPAKFKSLKQMVKVPGYLYLMAQLFKVRPFLKTSLAFGLLSHSLTADEIYHLYVKNFSDNSKIRKNFKDFALGWDPKYTQAAALKLKAFEKPVLILWGMDDTELFNIELGRRIAAIFQNMTFVEIPSALTYVQEDQPEIMIQKIDEFMNL